MGIPEPAPHKVTLSGNNFMGGEQFCGFFAAGILSTVTDIGLLYILTEYLGMWYLGSAVFSYSCGILLSFCLNKYMTFHDTRTNPLRQFPVFAAISVSSLILNISVLLVMVDIFSFHYLFGKIMAVTLSFSWNYFGQSRFTFRK